MSRKPKPGAARPGHRDPGRPGAARGPVRDRAPRGADLHAVPGRRARARHHVPVPVRRVQPEAVAGRGPDRRGAEAVQRWRKKISHVATQEMLHLSLVQNLLSAIGGAPHLSRPNFPHPASHYPAGVHLALMPFGEPGAAPLHVPRAPGGHGPRGRRGDGRLRPRAGPPCRRARSSRAARTSPPSGTCTGRSRPASRTWPTSTASAGCSSARRGPRPPSSTSAGPN